MRHVPLLCTITLAVLTSPLRAQFSTDHVKPLIGTAEHGHVFPGATVPLGMIQLSPDTREGTWDGSSGYHYSDQTILGFSHNHLSGTGVGDLGYISLMPTAGPLKMAVGKSPEDGYQARFSHADEVARPGYYAVRFPDSKMAVELTATTRVGVHRYTFPQSDQAHVILDLVHGVNSTPSDAAITVENDHTLSGYRTAGGWGGTKTFYFVAEFSKPFLISGLEANGQPTAGQNVKNRNVRAHLDYKTRAGEQLLVRVALSTVSVEGARKNLQAEMPGWDFDATAAAARTQWEQALAPIAIQTTDQKLRETFYTALYHTMVAPTILNDVDGKVRGPDGQVHDATGFTYYTELSLWDTFRAENPLLTLTQPARVNDLVKTMLAHYTWYGRKTLPIWVNAGRETGTMIGNHAIPIMAEAYAKGFRDWDAQEALADMIASVEGNQNFQNLYRQLGYVPIPAPAAGRGRGSGGGQRQSTSRTLEYAYDDACIARFAKMLGQEEQPYATRGDNWKNVFDSASGFMRGRLEDRTFLEPFDPNRIDFQAFTEANAWHYTFFVPQNVPALIQAMGGDAKFIEKLDACFDATAKIPNPLSDVTGLVGMYSHGNEPCHHMPFLYSYAGRPDKTQSRTRQIANALYDNTPAGLCGNDDCGQMSAWFVFTALGFYPVDPVSCVYVIGSPLVDKATLTLDKKHYPGGTFVVSTKNNSPQNPYIQSATLNGTPLTRSWITHDQIAKGGELHLVMGPQPSNWGRLPADRP
jgi:predicted alpha-1,2-mannosidase